MNGVPPGTHPLPCLPGGEWGRGDEPSQKQEFTAQPEVWLPRQCQQAGARTAVWWPVMGLPGAGTFLPKGSRSLGLAADHCQAPGGGGVDRAMAPPSGAQREAGEPQLLLGADTQALRLGPCTLHPSVIHPQRHTLQVPFPPPLSGTHSLGTSTGGHRCLPARALLPGTDLTSRGSWGGGGSWHR